MRWLQVHEKVRDTYYLSDLYRIPSLIELGIIKTRALQDAIFFKFFFIIKVILVRGGATKQQRQREALLRLLGSCKGRPYLDVTQIVSICYHTLPAAVRLILTPLAYKQYWKYLDCPLPTSPRLSRSFLLWYLGTRNTMTYVPDDSRYVRIVFNCRAGVPIFLKIRKISPVDQTINDKGVIWQYFFVVLY